MAFRLFALPSYERCAKKLGSRERSIAGLVILALQRYFESTSPGALGSESSIFQWEGRSYRLVFKKLRGPIWEAYLEGHVRILTRLEKDVHFLVFAGNHDSIRKFLKEV